MPIQILFFIFAVSNLLLIKTVRFMVNSKNSFASRFKDFLSERGIKFEIVYSVEGVTSFRLFEIISSRDLALSHIRLHYWQINFYDSVSYVFIVFENY